MNGEWHSHPPTAAADAQSVSQWLQEGGASEAASVSAVLCE